MVWRISDFGHFREIVSGAISKQLCDYCKLFVSIMCILFGYF